MVNVNCLFNILNVCLSWILFGLEKKKRGKTNIFKLNLDQWLELKYKNTPNISGTSMFPIRYSLEVWIILRRSGKIQKGQEKVFRFVWRRCHLLETNFTYADGKNTKKEYMETLFILTYFYAYSGGTMWDPCQFFSPKRL